MRLSKNFTLEEFKCKCCGKLIDNLHFRSMVAKLQDARDRAGIPFKILSAYRCPEHNKAVGGVRTSAHLKGVAVDLQVKSNKDRMTILVALLKAGFRRLGVGADFIHADVDDSKSQDVVWTYNDKGRERK